MINSLKRLGVVVLLGSLVMAAVAVAQAAIPDEDGVIHACYANNNGDLRVVDGESCRNNETELSWSQAGPEGAEGPQGPEGPVGPQGPQGNSTDAFHHKGRVANPAAENEITGLRNIPAGNYIIMATVSVVSDTSALGSTCLIGLNGTLDTFVVPVGSTLVIEEGGYGLATMTTAMHIPTDGTSINVRCGSADDDADLFGEVIAIQVGGTMHFQ